jgi:phage replication-related protein YjqB (UPF0714/DUF867 family)
VTPRKGPRADREDFYREVQQSLVARPTIRTQPFEVTGSGHLTEFLYDDGHNDGTLVCAAHAGDVEPGTGEQAIELATRLGATCWACFGYDDDVGAFDAFHPPSSEMSPAEYPLLDTIADRGFETVLSLHGLGDERVLVGGGVEAGVKRRVREALDASLSIDVETVSEGRYAGQSPDNFVNWLAADGRGLQLEQGKTARAGQSDATLDVLASLLRDGDL